MSTKDTAKPKPKRRRWFQFTLRTLLIGVVLFTLALSWLAVKLDRKRRERRAIMAIQELNGWVTYDYLDGVAIGAGLPPPEPPGPAWLRRLLGDDFFTDVVAVDLLSCQDTDAALKQLEAFPRLRRLLICDCRVTDGALRELETLTNLEELSIGSTQIGGAGLKHLAPLRNLKVLTVWDAGVTDSGLAHLKTLVNLRSLCLSNNRIYGPGLEHLTALPKLQKLTLVVNAPEKAIARLQQALPKCKIIYDFLPALAAGLGQTSVAPSRRRFRTSDALENPLPLPFEGPSAVPDADPFALPSKEPPGLPSGDPFGLPDQAPFPLPTENPPSFYKPEPVNAAPTPK